MDLSQYTDEQLEAMLSQPQESDLSGYSDAELEAMLGEPQEAPKDYSGVAGGAKALGSGALDTTTFGFADEAKAGVAAGYVGLMDKMGVDTGGLSMGDAYTQGLQQLRAEQEAMKEQQGAAYLTGQLAGAVVPAAAAPQALKQGVVRATQAGMLPSIATGAGLGAVSGGVYGFGSGEGDGRAREAAQGAGFGAAGGVAGAAGAQAISKLGNTGLAQRAKNFVTKKRSSKMPVAGGISANLPTDFATSRVSGEAIPLTKGALTQDAKIQSLEKAALKGGLGDEAQDIALRVQEEQQRQMRGLIEPLSQGGEEALGDAAQMVRGSFKSIKAKVNKAYDDARITQSVYISQAPIDEVFKPQVTAMLKDGGFDVADFSPRAQKIIKQIQDPSTQGGKTITAQNLEKMEFWRRKATNAASDAYGTSEGVALKEVVNAYDNFMAKLPEHALMSGDASALEAIQKARYLRKTQGVLFERSKAVQNLVKNNDLTNEELANAVLTGSTRAEKINKGAGAVVKSMRKAVPEEKQAEFAQNLKRGTMARVLSKSEGSTLVNGSPILEPNKLKKELDALISNKTFTSELFDEAEIKMLSALRNDLEKINSVQAGSDNYSNTAYALMKFFNRVPLMGLPAQGFKIEGDRAASAAARKAMSPALDGIRKELSGTPILYGAITGSQAATPTGDE